MNQKNQKSIQGQVTFLEKLRKIIKLKNIYLFLEIIDYFHGGGGAVRKLGAGGDTPLKGGLTFQGGGCDPSACYEITIQPMTFIIAITVNNNILQFNYLF